MVTRHASTTNMQLDAKTTAELMGSWKTIFNYRRTEEKKDFIAITDKSLEQAAPEVLSALPRQPPDGSTRKELETSKTSKFNTYLGGNFGGKHLALCT